MPELDPYLDSLYWRIRSSPYAVGMDLVIDQGICDRLARR